MSLNAIAKEENKLGLVVNDAEGKCIAVPLYVSLVFLFGVCERYYFSKTQVISSGHLLISLQ